SPGVSVSVATVQRSDDIISRAGTAGSGITRSRYWVRGSVTKVAYPDAAFESSSRKTSGLASESALVRCFTETTAGFWPALTAVRTLTAHTEAPSLPSTPVHPFTLPVKLMRIALG